MNYYNENDPKAAAWLRELIKAGHIAPGHVDERSIRDVRGSDLAGFCQCHFFAGIGGWSYALRLAGWADAEAVWTGSCPCQPFSSAGKAQGLCDERHLWPAFRGLIAERLPAIVFGEQVASKDGRAWLAGVRSDLEGNGYAVGAADLCAAGVGAPHIRQRLYWVATAAKGGCIRDEDWRQSDNQFDRQSSEGNRGKLLNGIAGCCTTGGMADGFRNGRRTQRNDHRKDDGPELDANGNAGRLAHAGSNGRAVQPESLRERDSRTGQSSAWRNFQLIPCRDGKSRRIESGTFPLAHGIPGRVGLLRGYGNAIVPQVAAEFIQAACDSFR